MHASLQTKATTRGNRRRRWPTALATLVATVLAPLAAALLAAAPMPAAAQDPTPTRATVEAFQFRVASNQTGEAYAVCPAETRALGGGVVQSGEMRAFHVLASGPLDASGATLLTNDGDVARQWSAVVENLTDTTRIFRVFALCTPTAASTATIEMTEFTVAVGDNVGAFAACPAGKRALGGGVVQSGSARDLYLRASGPLDASEITLRTNDGDISKRWYAAVANLSEEEPERIFRVFAICE